MENPILRRIFVPNVGNQTGSALEIINIYWPLIFLLAALGGGVGLLIAFNTRPTYRADTRIIQITDDQAASRALSSGISDLAAIAGISIGSGGASPDNLAYLQSDSLLIGYINEHKALGQVFDENWDEVNQRWKDETPAKVPTIGKALKRLHEGMFSITVDKKSGEITVSMKSHKPQVAAQWVNEIVADANRNLRERDMSEATRTMNYVEGEAEKPNQPIELKQALYRLIEEQMKKRSVAAARDDYAFRVIDKARIPESWEKVAPIRRAIFAIAVCAGGLLGVVVALILSWSTTNVRTERQIVDG